MICWFDMTDFIKLNAYQEEHGIFVRASAITVIHTNNEGMTKVVVQGLPAPLDIMQSPDEVLALMKDDAASLPARHVVDYQVDANNPAPTNLSVPPSKKSPQEWLGDVKGRYQKAG